MSPVLLYVEDSEDEVFAMRRALGRYGSPVELAHVSELVDDDQRQKSDEKGCACASALISTAARHGGCRMKSGHC